MMEIATNVNLPIYGGIKHRRTRGNARKGYTMANVTFHRTSKKQEAIKAYILEKGLRTADEMNAYKGVKLGDDDSVLLQRPATPEEMDAIKESVPMADSAIVSDVYALFNGRVILADRFAEIVVRVTL